ncbi:hypothetical protein [uncultured Methanospirillum sp.]|uniref:hypothetical protein n=1 Tax=uncultured Methanospirillum sp. TaxID=262503 RepID=UPI0029C79447|nr:hypothetical protein [uncultured Methanospirillum sp.]
MVPPIRMNQVWHECNSSHSAAYTWITLHDPWHTLNSSALPVIISRLATLETGDSY